MTKNDTISPTPKTSRITKKQKAQAIYKILCDLFPEAVTELTFTKDYEFLFAVIMSAQTTDKQVNILTERLFEKYNSLESFAHADLEILTKDMSSIGLYRAKAKNIKAAANLLIDTFDSKVPQTMEELISIPGAARKTANVVMHHIYNQPQGIAVDTHVLRLSQQLGLTKNTTPQKIELDLIKLIPQPEWGNFSIRLILYGRYYSPARGMIVDEPLAPYKIKTKIKPPIKIKKKRI